MTKNEKHLTDEEIEKYFEDILRQEMIQRNKKGTSFYTFITLLLIIGIGSGMLMLAWNSIVVSLFNNLNNITYIPALIMSIFSFLSLFITERLVFFILKPFRG